MRPSNKITTSNPDKEKLTKKNSQDLTAEDYYQIYRKTKEASTTKKGLERKSSFTSPSTTATSQQQQENRRESTSTSLGRSKSFSSYSARRPGHETLSDADQVDGTTTTKTDANMLEQSNKKPPEVKVNGGIAER